MKMVSTLTYFAVAKITAVKSFFGDEKSYITLVPGV
jgi:hypothetical protein